MKFLTVFLISFNLCSSAAFSQSVVEKSMRDELWKNCSKEFRNTQVPDKWKNESAVFLAMSLEYDGDLYKEKVNVHYRVKLLDKAAVSDYSELSFDKKYVSKIRSKASTYSLVAAKVVKSDGKEREIDLTQAVNTDAGSMNDLKVAVPDLEPGDIIDYFIALKEQNYVAGNFSQSEILDEKYPVVYRLIEYKLARKLFFRSKSFNGAPEFKINEQEKETIYTLVDSMHEKSPDYLWDYEHRTAPEIRYVISTSVLESEKRIAMDALDGFNYNTSDIGFIEDYMKGNFKGEKDPKKIVPELFYLMRNPIYMKAYYGTDQSNPLQAESAPDKFFLVMNKILKEYKIPHEIMLIPGRHYGPLDDLVSLGSCDLALKINTDPPFYISRPRTFSVPNELEYLFEGMSKVSKKYNQDGAGSEDLPIPVSKYEDNLTATKLQITLQEDKSKFNVVREVTAKGHNKDYHQYLIYTNYDYLKEYDQPKYQVQSSSLLRGIIKEYNNEKKKFEQRMAQDYNERDKRIKDELETEMEVKISDYKNLKISNIGMWHTNPVTNYSDEFTVDNMTKKAGPNVIVEVGKLIERQTFIKENQMKRSRDVYMSYPRMYEYEIRLTIPEGYTAEGLESLNKSIVNETGGFISTTNLEGNVLIVRTKKYYTNNFYNHADWPKIVLFLNPASEFNNAKLLLKKKG